ncbi:MAG: A/G-specific adenine glycosylase [Rhodospirillales bacterium]|nr:A/G-specific adenine glycosylase [Rhodospirillales bacterium]
MPCLVRRCLRLAVHPSLRHTAHVSPSRLTIHSGPPDHGHTDGADLLAWYDRHGRALPWRAKPADPYRVWLSEIMLQQTTVAAVIPYYEKFLTRFPDITDLARSSESDVMAAWAGLGYYARARNLHACAREVAGRGGFPADIAGLRALPGIGPYTAAAIAALAFDVPAVPVDGNVERIAARVFAITEALPTARKAIADAAARLGRSPAAQARPADFVQALFDLGATVCTPTTPSCGRCPWRGGCAANRLGIAAELPRKAPRRMRPLRYGVHFWLTDPQGRVLLRRRPPRGLLGGMAELPGTPWRAETWPISEALALAPMAARWRPIGTIRHGLTHFELHLSVLAATVPYIAADGFLCAANDLAGQALPSVMRKCAVLGRAVETSAGSATSL